MAGSALTTFLATAAATAAEWARGQRTPKRFVPALPPRDEFRDLIDELNGITERLRHAFEAFDREQTRALRRAGLGLPPAR